MKFAVLLSSATGVFGMRYIHKHSRSSKHINKSNADVIAVQDNSGTVEDANRLAVPREMLVWGRNKCTFFLSVSDENVTISTFKRSTYSIRNYVKKQIKLAAATRGSMQKSRRSSVSHPRPRCIGCRASSGLRSLRAARRSRIFCKKSDRSFFWHSYKEILVWNFG